MDDFYSKISRLKGEKKLTNSDLGAIINKKPDAFRIALKRESLSKLEIERLENYFTKTEQGNTQEKSPNDRFEDIVAKKVMELMEVKLNSIAIEFQETFEMELAEQSVRSQKILTRLNLLEENIIKETRKIKNNI